MNKKAGTLQCYPLSAERWSDLEDLFGERGECGGCWCTYWRIARAEFEEKKGAGNKRLLKRLVKSGTFTGLLAYDNGESVGWCSVGPREDFPTLGRSRILARVDQQPVWSVVCFFVRKDHRNQGFTVELLKATVDYAKRKRVAIVEGYPVEPTRGTIPAPFAYTGLPSAFRQAGFVEVARRSPTRPIMRYYVKGLPAPG
jgi:GNAT superfamily N-acetyltransferase